MIFLVVILLNVQRNCAHLIGAFILNRTLYRSGEMLDLAERHDVVSVHIFLG